MYLQAAQVIGERLGELSQVRRLLEFGRISPLQTSRAHSMVMPRSSEHRSDSALLRGRPCRMFSCNVAQNVDSITPPQSEESPAKQLVHLLEQHGLEDSLRAILSNLEARRLGNEREARQRVLTEFLLEGETPLTQAELDEARREWQG